MEMEKEVRLPISWEEWQDMLNSINNAELQQKFKAIHVRPADDGSGGIIIGSNR